MVGAHLPMTNGSLLGFFLLKLNPSGKKRSALDKGQTAQCVIIRGMGRRGTLGDDTGRNELLEMPGRLLPATKTDWQVQLLIYLWTSPFLLDGGENILAFFILSLIMG